MCRVFAGRTTTVLRLVCACVNVSRRTETAPTPLHILVKPPHKLVETRHHHFKTMVKTCQIRLLPYHNRCTTLSQTFRPNSCWNGSDFYPIKGVLTRFCKTRLCHVFFFTWTGLMKTVVTRIQHGCSRTWHGRQTDMTRTARMQCGYDTNMTRTVRRMKHGLDTGVIRTW